MSLTAKMTASAHSQMLVGPTSWASSSAWASARISTAPSTPPASPSTTVVSASVIEASQATPTTAAGAVQCPVTSASPTLSAWRLRNVRHEAMFASVCLCATPLAVDPMLFVLPITMLRSASAHQVCLQATLMTLSRVAPLSAASSTKTAPQTRLATDWTSLASMSATMLAATMPSVLLRTIDTTASVLRARGQTRLPRSSVWP